MLYLKLGFTGLLGLLVFPFCTQSCNKGNSTQTLQADNIEKNRPQYADTVGSINANAQSKIMKFEILFESDPGTPKAVVAPLKYNKKGWASVEWDDNSWGSVKGYNIAKNKFYTDGCGNRIPYRGAVAVIGMNQYLCKEVANQEGNVSYTKMKEFVQAGWDIENHSYYHEPKGNCHYGTDWYRNIKELDALILKRIGYKMNGGVVPVNYEGFATAAKKFGYLFSASQGTFDGLEPGGKPTWKPTNDFAAAPKQFSAFGRIFYDNWVDMEKDVKKSIDALIVQRNHYFRFGSHNIDEAAFKRLVDYFEQKTKDQFLFLPTREIMEYRIVASLPIKYQKIQNKLVVEVDATKLSDRIRWRDLSFNVSANSKISSVKNISGIEKVSFNAGTGLVNIFRQVKQWN